MASKSKVLYTGVTNDINRRAHEHKKAKINTFTGQYYVNSLVYVECYSNINDAITREKQIKNWERKWKIELIEKENPNWIDYYEELN